ncbi:hypothetical protein HZB03_02325 [Candidatus Woesearchaeota archaeon]|nr:hypothetical protein [Candidatus Woesearchaeota archaeon]
MRPSKRLNTSRRCAASLQLDGPLNEQEALGADAFVEAHADDIRTKLTA